MYVVVHFYMILVLEIHIPLQHYGNLEMAGLCCCEYLIFIVNVYYITLYIYCTSLYVYKCIKIDTVQLFFIIINTKNIID